MSRHAVPGLLSGDDNYEWSERPYHSDWRVKVNLRLDMLAHLPERLCLLETHGGIGMFWQALYQHQTMGVVIERDVTLCQRLERQRGHRFQVFQGDAERVIGSGTLASECFDLVDCDPYGQPWPVLNALFLSQRVWPQTLGIVVTDGLRKALRYTHGGVGVRGMGPWVKRYQGQTHAHYLDICQERLIELAGRAGYVLVWWSGSYGGAYHTMSYYAAKFVRSAGADRAK